MNTYERVISTVGDAIGADRVRSLPFGGSPARSWVFDTPTGQTVLKAQLAELGRVDGHRVESIRQKADQLNHIAQTMPGLRPYVVPVIRTWTTDWWSGYLMPFVPGRPLATLRDSPRDLVEHLNVVFEVLGSCGWNRFVDSADESFFSDVHESRVRRRQWLLKRHLPRALLDERSVINREEYPCANETFRILRRIAGKTARGLRPAGLSFPVHGDMNLGNILVADTGFTLIDPRGTLIPWDPVYDLAKALFSLTAFESAMTHGLDVSVDESGVSVKCPQSTSTDCIVAFWNALESSALGVRLSREDPHWRLRLIVSHAVHCLAEAACRLSDPTPRRFPSRYERKASILLATGLYAYGLELLDGSVDVVRGQSDPLDEVLKQVGRHAHSAT